MRDQAAQAVATGATPDESVAQAPAVAAPAAAEHQSAELLESMGAPTGQPAGGNPAAAQASELAHANEPSGDGSGVAADTPDAPAGIVHERAA